MSKRFADFLLASKDQVDRQLADFATDQATTAAGTGAALDSPNPGLRGCPGFGP